MNCSAKGLLAVLLLFSSVINAQSITVPTGGNAWALERTGEGIRVRNNGITNWTKINEGFTAYIRVTQPGTLKVWLETGTVTGNPEIAVSIFKQTKNAVLKGAGPSFYIGEWSIKDSGYVPVVVKGIKKEGCCFPDVVALKLEGTALTDKASYTKNNEGNFFHWGRRGPSVHMGYQLPKDVDAEWFYNEVTVPAGNDVVGSYFMANGFGEGYFGMQVNSATERRILFSVWSPYQTDDPKQIPEDHKIKMLKKGEDVYTGEFGNEGSGGQSILRYPWKAGTTNKFLLHVVPDGDSHTVYTAYFYDGAKNTWLLVASFRRPKLSTYLKRPHSFLENFSPNQGDIERKVFFGNQWVRDTRGNWHELTKARFTADNTARVGYRKDYAGGVKGQQFYLRNCGFFNDFVPYDTMVERQPTGKTPQVDLDALP
ncbi:DUF3472 domain-containing protein [Niabella aurantiaca]|uniref:DUF3472 domain-containing protein n=1 Tax=Niabella aurantiaca TaxID=379900 RepID=UPI0003679720|nr:DUF3472 domain-containing protein [Niabella aurantiaca]